MLPDNMPASEIRRQESDRVLVDAIRLRKKSAKNVMYGKRAKSAPLLIDRAESFASLSSMSQSDHNPFSSRCSSFLVVDDYSDALISESVGVDYIHFYITNSPCFNLFCILFDDKLRPLEVVSHQHRRATTSKIIYRTRTPEVPPRICMNVEAISSFVTHIVFFLKSNERLPQQQETSVSLHVMKSDLQEMICSYDVNMLSGEQGAVGDAVVCSLYRNDKNGWGLRSVCKTVGRTVLRTQALVETVR